MSYQVMVSVMLPPARWTGLVTTRRRGPPGAGRSSAEITQSSADITCLTRV